MTDPIQLKIGHVFWLAGLVFTLVTTTISGLWIFTESKNDSLAKIHLEIRAIDTRLSRIEGYLSVDRQPLLANTENKQIHNYINKKYYE